MESLFKKPVCEYVFISYHYVYTLSAAGINEVWVHVSMSLCEFWRDVHGVLEAVFKKKMYLNFKIMYLGDVIRLEYAKQDKYLLRVC